MFALLSRVHVRRPCSLRLLSLALICILIFNTLALPTLATFAAARASHQGLTTAHAVTRPASLTSVDTPLSNAITSAHIAQAPAPCNLYPIALSSQSLNGVAVGATITDIANGTQPGNF